MDQRQYFDLVYAIGAAETPMALSLVERRMASWAADPRYGELVEMLLTQRAVLKVPTPTPPVQKHLGGAHDQKSHGKWAKRYPPNFKTLGESQAWAREHGVQVVPATRKEAAHQIAQYTYDFYEKRHAAEGDDTYIPRRSVEEIEKNYLTNWKINATRFPADKGSKITEEHLLTIQNAVNRNSVNPLMQKYEAKFGGRPPVMVRTADATGRDNWVLMRNNGAIHVPVDDGDWWVTKANKRPVPGEATLGRNGAVISLRHEFGHTVFDELEHRAVAQVNDKGVKEYLRDPKMGATYDRLRSTFYEKQSVLKTAGSIKGELSEYANDRFPEFFSEAFALATSPTYRPKDWAPWVQGVVRDIRSIVE